MYFVDLHDNLYDTFNSKIKLSGGLSAGGLDVDFEVVDVPGLALFGKLGANDVGFVNVVGNILDFEQIFAENLFAPETIAWKFVTYSFESAKLCYLFPVYK